MTAEEEIIDLTATDENEIVEPENRLPEVTIADLPPRLQAAVARAGWEKLTPVQRKAMPYIISGRDLMVQARTGSGKTGAFVMPIMELINHRQDGCQALVLVPTRELAQQVAKEAAMLAGPDGMRTTAVYGGVKYGPQLDAFKRGDHLIVGTPGRILDHLLRGSLKLDHLRVLIFDEADRMLSMGFYPDMQRIQGYLPDRRLFRSMFSATFPPRVQGLASRFLHEPSFLSLSKDHVHVAETEHATYTLKDTDKVGALVRIIEEVNPDNAIIFCNTKSRTNFVSVVLQRFGYDADELSGDIAQGERERVMDRVRQGKLRFLVATDVAARGIDIPALSHVIQYDVPQDYEVYIHRAGRTGRAGASGEALTIVADFSEQVQINRIARLYNIEFEERILPSQEDVTKIVAERTSVLLEAKLRDRDNLKKERMARFVPVVQEWAQDEEGLNLMAMLLDDYYQASLHPPAEPEADDRPRQSSDRSSSRGGGRSGNRSSGDRRRRRS